MSLIIIAAAPQNHRSVAHCHCQLSSSEMEEERTSAAALTVTSIEDVYSEKEFRQGLRKALYHKRNRENTNVLLSPKRRDELLEESFPKIHHAEGNTAIKELTDTELVAMRSGLQEVIQSDIKEKMALLREQLSEYHSVLEDVITFKNRCKRLEQEKNDIVSLCREVCQVRDDKIALLEKELTQIRNERRCSISSSSSNSSSSDWVSSIISGGSEGQYAHGHRPQRNHLHPTPPLPPTQTTLSRMNNHPHPYYSNDSRRITIESPPPSSISQSSIQTRLQELRSDNAFNTGAIRPLPFPGSFAPSLHPPVNQAGVLLRSSSSGENRSVKRHKSNGF